MLKVNLKELSEDDLFKRMEDVSKKIVKAAQISSGSQALMQLRGFLAELQEERSERQMATWRQQEEKKNPNSSIVIETDPDMINVPFIPMKRAGE